MSTDSATRPSHPSPHRDRTPLWRQFFGLFTAPVAWFLQFNIAYGLTSYACYPDGVALGHFAPGWAWTRVAAIVVTLVAAGLAIWSSLVALGVWRAARGEKKGDSSHLIEAGEGRTRYLGVWGTLTSFGFLAVILFDLVMAFGASACRG